MNWRKHIVLIVGGGLAVLLLLAALAFLIRFQSRYAAVDGELANARTRLQQLMTRSPFPSTNNIAKQRENLAQLQEQAAQLEALLQRNQIKPDKMEPAEFAPELEKTSRRLVQRAKEAGVDLPERFAFGFPRYAAGELPSQDAVPRLALQLRAVEVVCELLFQARVLQVDGLDRERFDESGEQAQAVQASARSRRGQAESAPVVAQVPMAETNELYGVERLTVAFTAHERSAREVLNALLRHPLFISLADIRIENKLAAEGKLGKKQPVKPLGGERPAGVAPQYPSHKDRVIAGPEREYLAVTLVLDLYQFHDTFKTEAKP